MDAKITVVRKFVLLVFLSLMTCVLSAQHYTISTIAGNGSKGFSGDGGPATSAKLNSPHGVAFDDRGHVLIVDHDNARIRKVDSNTGVITTVAGNGVAGFSGDGGPATSAMLNGPTHVHDDLHGHLLIVDHDNARIRSVDKNTGVITTIAGNGVAGFSGDEGPATMAQLNGPHGVCTNSLGDIFIADQGNSRVRVIDHATGNIHTVAGNGLFGFLGDGNLASLAVLNSPSHVAVDNNDHLLIVDHANARIRKVDKNTGIITTICGTGILGFGGDGGLATLAMLNSPMQAFVHSNGNIHIVDKDNLRIRVIDANTGIISTIAGNGVAGFAGDTGDALLAELNSPACGAINEAGEIIIADELNQRIRKLSLCVAPNISTQPVNASACEGDVATFTTVALGAGLNFKWQEDDGTGFKDCNDGSTFSGSTTAVLTVHATASLNGHRYRCNVSNCGGLVASASATLTVKSRPAISFSANGMTCTQTSICCGASLTITASGASTYLWSTGSTSASITVNPSITTVYSVTGTSNGCATTAAFTVNVSSSPIVSVTASSSSLCQGESATLTAVGASTYTWSNGQTGASIVVSPNATTTYSVTGTTNGCSASASLSITVKPKPVVTVTASSSSICAGGSTTLTASGATNYLWSTGQTGASITVSPTASTTYSVTGTTNGCSAMTSVSITVSPSVSVSVSASPSSICLGESATLTASGATSYMWSTGQTGASIVVSPSATTTYTVTGTNVNGCSGSASVIVTVKTKPVVTVTATPSTICTGASATLTAAGATSYVWSTGQTGASIVVSPGATTTYSVTGTSNGCSATASVAVTVSPSVSVSVSASSSSICVGESTTLTASGATNFNWSNGQTGSSIVVSPSATTTYTVIGTNSSGCSGTASIAVTVKPKPVVTVSASPSVICVGASTTLTASGASTYAWSTGATTASITVSPTVTTTYSVTGTSNGCSSSASVTVFVNAAPNVSITASPSSICAGGSTTLTASGATSFLWNTGATTASITVSPSATTTYSVTGTSNGCTATASITVSVNASPTITVSASPASICAGSSTTLTASGATSYTWSNGQTGANILVSPNATTAYSVTGTNASGCTATANVVVTVNAKPVVTINSSPSSICAGGSATLTASGATSYVWSNGQTGASITVSPSATTTYSVTGTSNGCSSTASVTVSVSAAVAVSASASPSVICAGGSATLTASGASTYTWSNGQTGASIIVSPGATTTYSVTGTNEGGCSGTASVTVFVNPLPAISVSASPSSICAGGSATLTAVGSGTFLWSTGETSASIVVSPSVTTTYSVTTTVNGCSASASVTVSVNGSISVSASASPSVMCAGSSTTLTASGATSYAWSNGQTGASIVVNPSATTTYSVTGTNSGGCSGVASVTVCVNTAPTVSVSASPSVICSGGLATLTASGAGTYIWSTGQTGASIVVSPGITTTYSVTGTLNGCSATAFVTVFVNGAFNLTASASPSSICAGGSSTLTASGASTYIWSTGETSASIAVSPSVTTTYSVTGFQNGCSATASVTVGVNSSIAITAVASPAAICAGSSATLTASGADSFVWSTGQTGSSIVVSPGATTTYSCTGYRGGCSSVASVTVFVNPRPPVACTASPSIITLGLTSTLTASGAVSYQWSNGATGSSIVVIPLVTSLYSVVGTDANGCTNTASVTVTVNLLGGLGLRNSAAPPDTATVQSEPMGEISAYPNPTSDVFYLKNVPKNSSIEMYNIIGERIFSGASTADDQVIDLSARPMGMYILKVHHQGEVIYWTKILRKQ